MGGGAVKCLAAFFAQGLQRAGQGNHSPKGRRRTGVILFFPLLQAVALRRLKSTANGGVEFFSLVSLNIQLYSWSQAREARKDLRVESAKKGGFAVPERVTLMGSGGCRRVRFEWWKRSRVGSRVSSVCGKRDDGDGGSWRVESDGCTVLYMQIG
ncbi:hypothetical protein LX32DRAFT_174444 [Colletotrichum zoysiae]|uniref:Uncharacterized protein n=1 Tax=Colletotrichum zoysiae TaxID=1216348 RepID=A0AAD9H6U6_9PEZI|nr:hypothetical protein LX32DRAFT_174444 [Colletotrichum zoysiae]